MIFSLLTLFYTVELWWTHAISRVGRVWEDPRPNLLSFLCIQNWRSEKKSESYDFPFLCKFRCRRTSPLPAFRREFHPRQTISPENPLSDSSCFSDRGFVENPWVFLFVLAKSGSILLFLPPFCDCLCVLFLILSSWNLFWEGFCWL